MGLREIRKGLIDIQVESVIEAEGERGITTIEPAQVSITFTLEKINTRVYKISFDMFFLFSCIGLVLVEGNRRDYLVLVSIHFIGGILSTAFMWISINSNPGLLIIPDALSGYFIPLCSLGLVALVYIQKKNELRNEP